MLSSSRVAVRPVPGDGSRSRRGAALAVALGLVIALVIARLAIAGAVPDGVLPDVVQDLVTFVTSLLVASLPFVVLGLDGQPIATRAWFPIPGTADILIAARDGSVLRGDPSGLTPFVPLGSYVDVYGVTPDGAGFVAADAFGPVLVDLASGTATRITASLIDGVEPYLGAVAMVDASRWVAKVAVPDSAGGFVTGMTLDDGSSSTLIELGGSAASIAEFRVSPGGQYLFVVLDEGAPGEATTGPTLVVDLGTLAVLETLPGVDPRW